MHKKMPATTWLAWVHVFNYFTCLLDRGASDMWISYIAFIFDLYFDESKSYIEKNHYIERSFDKIKIEDLEILKKYRALEKCALEYINGGCV